MNIMLPPMSMVLIEEGRVVTAAAAGVIIGWMMP